MRKRRLLPPHRPRHKSVPLRRYCKNKWIRLVFLLILFVVYCLVMTLCVGTACPFTLLTGFPCPACGMTRANLLALSFRFGEAFAMHPLFFLSVPAAAAAVAFTARPDWAMKRWVSVVSIALVVVLFGVYIYRMVVMYPEVEPMVYRYQSLFGLFRRWLGF